MNPIHFLTLCSLSFFQEDVFRSETRVVNVEAIVRDAVTRMPVKDLRAEQFRLMIDGKPRKISYFQHRGDDRRPLAMMVYFNLAVEGALRQMSQKAAQDSFAAALRNLDPKDEVAVYANKDWFAGVPVRVSSLEEAVFAAEKTGEGRQREKSMTLAVEAAIKLTKSRPESQVVLVYISDGMNTLDTMEGRGREKLSRLMSENNISFSALNVDMLASYAAAAAVLNPVGKMFGMSVTGSGDGFAKETGGVAVKVTEPSRIGEALGQVLSAYDSRYSLGYQAEANEYRDDKWHRLEVRVDGPNLIVTARKWWKSSSKLRQ
jgi:VWFA-related protein